MKKRAAIYQGESFGLVITLLDFVLEPRWRVSAVVSTTVMGKTLAGDTTGAGDFPIDVREGGQVYFNILPEQSATLTAGPLRVEVNISDDLDTVMLTEVFEVAELLRRNQPSKWSTCDPSTTILNDIPVAISMFNRIGADGKSAYKIAVDNGFSGTEQEWLESLKGGPRGKSAYEVAVENGYAGTAGEWLESLHGTDGKSAYEAAVEHGYVGDERQFNASLAAIDNMAVKTDIPTMTSQLENDSDFATSADVAREIENALPTRVSELENDAGFATAGQVAAAVSAAAVPKADTVYVDGKDTALSARISGNTDDISANSVGIQNNADRISLLGEELADTNERVDRNIADIIAERQRAVAAENALGERIDNFRHPDVLARNGEAITVATDGEGNNVVGLAIDTNDKLLVQTPGGLRASLSVAVQDNVLYLFGKNVDGAPQVIGSAVLPAASGGIVSVDVVENPVGRPEGVYLVIVFDTESGQETVYVNLSAIQQAYTPGNAGIGISGDLKVSLIVDGNADFEVGENGLRFKTGRRAITTDETAKLAGVAAGAQVNVVEVIRVNGVVLTVANKAVDIDLSAYALVADIPTRTSQLQNNSGFVTTSDVNGAITTALTPLNQAIAGKADSDSIYTKAQTDTMLGNKADAADVYGKDDVDAMLEEKADSDSIYTKAQTDTMLGEKADAADVYGKDDVDAMLEEKADSDDVYSKADADGLFAGKVDKVNGKGLSANDYTDEDLAKVALIETGGDGKKFLSDKGEYEMPSTGVVGQRIHVPKGLLVSDPSYAKEGSVVLKSAYPLSDGVDVPENFELTEFPMPDLSGLIADVSDFTILGSVGISDMAYMDGYYYMLLKGAYNSSGSQYINILIRVAEDFSTSEYLAAVKVAYNSYYLRMTAGNGLVVCVPGLATLHNVWLYDGTSGGEYAFKSITSYSASCISFCKSTGGFIISGSATTAAIWTSSSATSWSQLASMYGWKFVEDNVVIAPSDSTSWGATYGPTLFDTALALRRSHPAFQSISIGSNSSCYLVRNRLYVKQSMSTANSTWLRLRYPDLTGPIKIEPPLQSTAGQFSHVGDLIFSVDTGTGIHYTENGEEWTILADAAANRMFVSVNGKYAYFSTIASLNISTLQIYFASPEHVIIPSLEYNDHTDVYVKIK